MTATLLAPTPDAPTAPPQPLAGTLRFAHYAFMPNQLGFCGGEDHRGLFQYATEGVSDRGLRDLLGQFSGAMPYLKLIARENGNLDPFDPRVVEAYWLGNDLLRGVEARQLYEHLATRFAGQLRDKVRDIVLGKAPAGARPAHIFHVLDVYSRVGKPIDSQSLAVMDNCRISWGKVVRVDGPGLVVEREPLELHAGKLALGTPRTEHATRQIEGLGFADAAQPGDWVALHWGWVCETLNADQCARLEGYTRYHLAIANQTI